MVKLPRKLKKIYRQFRQNPFKKFTITQRKLLEKFLKRESLMNITNSIYNLLNTPLEQRVFKPSNMPISKYVSLLDEQFAIDVSLLKKSPFENVINEWVETKLSTPSLEDMLGEDYEPSI